MLKILSALLCLLLLAGCGNDPSPAAEATAAPTEATEATAAPTEPDSLYDPHSALEQHTAGAVKVYPLGRSDASGIVPIGEDLLLFAGNELLRLDGNRVHEKARATLDILISPTDPAVQVSEKGITYFDGLTNDLVFLDGSLKEVSRMALPENLTGNPALSHDRKNLYYFTASGLRTLNLESRIERLVTEMAFPSQTITALHCSDSIVQCAITDESGVCATLFLDVKNGALICRSDAHLRLTTLDDQYIAEVMDGQYPEKLIGTADSEPKLLRCSGLQDVVFPLLELEGIATLNPKGQISFFDISDGARPYGIALPEEIAIRDLTADPVRNCIWGLAFSEAHGCDVLLRWDPTANPTQDNTRYLVSRPTAERPDTAGLEACAALAAEIGAKHRVRILTWLDVLQIAPKDYTLEPEYQTEVLTDALNRLDTALSHYPKGFLREAASEMGDGELRIGLVRSISANGWQDVPDFDNGIQYWDDQMNACVQLPIGSDMEKALHYELFHVVESRIFSNSLALDDWEMLNPEGFEYSYNYLEYESRQQDIHCADGTLAFIDAYGTTFPKEDRAGIMACAMMPGNDALFESPALQAKLRAICTGIREAYRLKKTDAALLWEQYLDEPLKLK